MMTDPIHTTIAPAEITRIYHYWHENSQGQMVDQEIEVEAPTRIRVSSTGHHYIETENGFGLIMPPGWAFVEVHPKHGTVQQVTNNGFDIRDDAIAAAAS
jgi:hypothetical protein